MSTYRRDFHETNNEILEKVNKSIKKEFDSELICSEKYLKTKIKSYKGKINTSFHNNKIPKEGSQCICLSVILIDSIIRIGNEYYSQVFLEECEYVVKEKKVPEYITDTIEISSDSGREDSDEENANKKNSDEENFDEKK